VTKTWFITGAARGFGFEIAKAALAAGDNDGIAFAALERDNMGRREAIQSADDGQAGLA
jgi:NAD(P)-dependent dehydrogenase (short-subunit alcohol dehydrogenase family)